MWLKSFRLQNFSSFKDTGQVELARGFNIFAGQNNSGKSALLRALSLDIDGNPHRSPEAFRDADLPTSRLEFDVSIMPRELVRRMNVSGKSAYFPIPDRSNKIINRLQRLLDRNEEVVLRLFKNPNQNPQRRGKSSIEGFEGNPNTGATLVEIAGEEFKIRNQNSNDNLAEVMQSKVDEPIFYFSPERLNIGRKAFSTEEKLNSNASNLPSVLAYLQGSRGAIFKQIEMHLVEMMPGISSISVTPANNNEFEILVWPQEDTSRSELSFSLASSGTGVSQLLAILTAVVSTDQAIIVIDEINTFLHPTASKALISLLRSEYPQHQYIISTHSSDVLSSAVSDKVFLIKRSEFVSQIESVDLGDFQKSREVAGHLGFSMMDVFGHERLVWVEGQTEELCFPYLLRHFGRKFDGIGFVAVASTAEFSERGASTKSIIELYDKVARASAPLLQGMAFGLDKERLSDEAAAKLERSKRKLKFLARRTLENYLLRPEAIATVIGRELGEAVSTQAVKDRMQEIGGEPKFGAAAKWTGDLSSDDWLQKVDAPKMLDDIFLEVTGKRLEFRKTTHSIELLKWIVADNPEDASELLSFVDKLVEVAKRGSKP